jgi:hypothetical protein
VKIKKTSGGTMRTGTPLSKGARGGTPSDDSKNVAPAKDIVSLSSDAIAAAARAQEAQALSAAGEDEGPLPDPKATAQAILEKELEAVFEETYL